MGSITNRLMWQSSLAAIEGAFTDGLAWEMDYTALRSSEKRFLHTTFDPTYAHGAMKQCLPRHTKTTTITPTTPVT